VSKVIWLLGLVVMLAPAAVIADPDSDAIEKIPTGRSVVFAAELGTTPDILGMGVERNLTTTDSNGDSHRVFPNKVTNVAVNQYDAKFELVDNSFLLEAHGHYLFGEAGIKANTNRRYMVVRAYQVSKVAKVSTEGRPVANAPMYASRIFYGWALYVVIEGDSSSFTSEVAAELMGAGGKLGATIKANKLTSRVHLIGLKPKKAGDVPIAVTTDEVQASFETSPDPQPIFVEYTLMQDMVVDAIPWTKNEFTAGRYAVNVDISVMDSKASGKPWDVGSLPDPNVTLFVNGQKVTSCKQQDSIESHCLHDRVIDVDAITELMLRVVDADVAADDPIGTTIPLQVMSSGGAPRSPIELKTTDQLRWAKVTFTPVR
jgi:hypothetical protein